MDPAPAPIQALRDLTRTRKPLVREQAQHTLRIQQVLEDANVKLTGLITDLLGVSGRALLDALGAGETDPERLAARTPGRLRACRAQLGEALQGQVPEHHRFLLRQQMGQIDALQQAIDAGEARLGEAMAPFRAAVAHLTTMPGGRDGGPRPGGRDRP